MIACAGMNASGKGEAMASLAVSSREACEPLMLLRSIRGEWQRSRQVVEVTLSSAQHQQTPGGVAHNSFDALCSVEAIRDSISTGHSDGGLRGVSMLFLTSRIC